LIDPDFVAFQKEANTPEFRRNAAIDPQQRDNAVIYIGGDLLFLLKDSAEWIIARATGNGFEPQRTRAS